MTATFQWFNHTRARFQSGANADSDEYRLYLLSASASFDGSHTTFAQVTNSGAYVVSGNGWSASGEVIPNWAAAAYATDDAQITADDVVVAISGADLGPFSHYLIHNETDDAPVALVSLSAPKTVPDGEAAHFPWVNGAVLRVTLGEVANFHWYNHTAQRFLSGANADSDDYVAYYLPPAATFDATDVTVADATSGGTLAVSGHGWSGTGEAIVNWAAGIVNTDEGAIAADDTEAPVIGGDLGPYGWILVANATDDAVVCLIELASEVTTPNGYMSQILWAAGQVLTLEASA